MAGESDSTSCPDTEDKNPFPGLCFMMRGIEFLFWERPAAVLNCHSPWVLPGSVRAGALEGQGEATFSPLTFHIGWPSLVVSGQATRVAL